RAARFPRRALRQPGNRRTRARGHARLAVPARAQGSQDRAPMGAAANHRITTSPEPILIMRFSSRWAAACRQAANAFANAYFGPSSHLRQGFGGPRQRRPYLTAIRL